MYLKDLVSDGLSAPPPNFVLNATSEIIRKGDDSATCTVAVNTPQVPILLRNKIPFTQVTQVNFTTKHLNDRGVEYAPLPIPRLTSYAFEYGI